MRRAAALVLVLGCAPAPVRLSTGPVVVVGCAPGPALARERAASLLRSRMKAEIERREALETPAARVRDWRAVERSLDAEVPALLARDETVFAGGDAVVSLRVPEDDFEAALARAREAGRRRPLRVACVPLAASAVSLYEVRELYGSALREALRARSLEPLSTDEIYAALEELGTLEPSSEESAAALGRLARADALVCGSVRLEGATVVLEVVLRDARSGRLLGGFGGPVDAASIRSVARRHAVVLEEGLGVGP